MIEIINYFKNHLGKLIDGRDSYLHDKSSFAIKTNYKIHNRIFEIYQVEVPEVLGQIWRRLELATNEEQMGRYQIRNVYLDLCSAEKSALITQAFNSHYNEIYFKLLTEEFEKLSKEMAACLKNLKITRKD